MDTDYNLYLEGLKSELRYILSEKEFIMWIDRLSYKDFDEKNKKLILSVPSNFLKDNIIKYYSGKLNDVFQQISGINDSYVEIVLDNSKKETIEIRENSTMSEKKIIEKAPLTESEIMSNLEIESGNTGNNGKKNNQKNDNDENFTFDTFIVGSSNEFAAHAAKAVAENPGKMYNPYLVWGESGLGKTHLLKAIKKHIQEKNPNKKIKYVTAEDFTNDLVKAINASKGVNNSSYMESFRNLYRTLDVLIIDDVQFFANKEAMQTEFFFTFEKLYNEDKQMVFSSDQPISKIKKMDERIKGRFTMGLTVDLRPQDYELKMAILTSLAEKYNLELDREVIDYICTNIIGNIRDLKGAFKDLFAYASIMNIKKITLDITLDRLKEKITNSMLTTQVSVDKIIQIVGEYYDVSTNDLLSSKRTKSIAFARQIAMYLSRKSTRLSTTQIGSYFGNKEHATVMHATKKIEDLINTDNKIKGDIINLTTRINNL